MLEPICLGIVVLYWVLRLRGQADASAIATRMAVMSAAALLAEDTVIRAYGFYFYTDVWSVFIDRVPLLVALIWPVVIDSAWQMGRSIAARPLSIGLVTAAIVFVDAWLIEPVSVQAGLWRWTHPGLFDVPPIGVFGWSCFVFSAVTINESLRARGASSVKAAVAMLLAPAPTHLLLVMAWWLGFRWLDGPIPTTLGVVVAVVVLMGLSIAVVRAKVPERVRVRDLWMRVPGSLFFFVLLGKSAGQAPALLAYAPFFALPYIVVMGVARRNLASAGAATSPNSTIGSAH
jgi:hypothetical protein